MKLYQYAIVYKPNEAHRKEGKVDLILVDISSVLQKDEATVRVFASRRIPAEYSDQLDEVEILVRSF